VLNGWGKQKAFKAGLLPEDAFRKAWKTVWIRLERKGVDVGELVEAKA